MTVNELIEKLQGLPEEFKDFDVDIVDSSQGQLPLERVEIEYEVVVLS